jgi:hypothetical protein
METKDKNFGNPALEAYDHTLKSAVYEHRGSVIDFRKATPQTLAKLAADPTFKRLQPKGKPAKAETENSETTEKTGKGKAPSSKTNKEGASGPDGDAQ